MLKAAMLDAWPLALLLVAVCGGLAALVRLAAQLRSDCVTGDALTALRTAPLHLHRDERGSVQSLSFVLTVPLFIMLMLLAVQITQVMIGQIIVHYAAFAAARAASVWVPARIQNGDQPVELANWLNLRAFSGTDSLASAAVVSPKIVHIHRAAALALTPLGPSRNLGLQSPDAATSQSLLALFGTYSSSAQANSRIPARLASKWAYAFLATRVDVATFHRRFGPGDRDEPPLWNSDPLSVEAYYQPTEIGWRDEITVTVTHNFALLPGPGRLLARRANESRRTDTVSRSIFQQAGVYYLPLSASATLVPEGDKSTAPYVHSLQAL